MENGGTNPAPGFPALSDVGVDLTGADWIASEKDNEANYLKTVAELPSVYRSAMMLSYLEDFSTSEIATPDSVGPYQDDSLSDRGRGVLHAQLYEHLMDTDGAAGQDDRNEASD
jgi:DNA-directed RNA polymerase specialized sigma24 family protein